MKKRPKPCFKTLAILGCIAAVLLSASAVVADVVMTRLMQAVREAPEAAAAPLPVAPAPP
jgi:ABC-type nitrate/sulfonate/bicarbonate transport system permease component